MRLFRHTACLAALALTVGACASNADDGADPDITDTADAADAATDQGDQTDAETRTVTDIAGEEVTVPADPQRVVTLSEPTLDGALALEVTPIGTVAGRGQSTVPHYLLDEGSDIEIIGNVAEPNFEAIGQADPDLILYDGTSINDDPETIEVLSNIAPTYNAGEPGGDWRETFTNVANALNLADEGEAVLDEYDTRVAEVADELGDWTNDTFSIVRWQGDSASLILQDLPPSQALADLGLARPENQSIDGSGRSEPISQENLHEMDADHIFFGTLGGSSVDNPDAGGDAGLDGSEQALADAETIPGFSDLTAYQDDRITLVDGSRWNSTGGPLLMRGVVDDVADALADHAS